MSIERFLAERGVTRCPDVATTVPLVWDKKKRKWVRPPAVVAREASAHDPRPLSSTRP